MVPQGPPSVRKAPLVPDGADGAEGPEGPEGPSRSAMGEPGETGIPDTGGIDPGIQSGSSIHHIKPGAK